ncbi:putative lipopolysaccharide heptosyltransferase III [Wielerella bovis]|uniref:putative lipopolysaccharide heptosyltransferase III n=1 Tax=Wielerella bovis TaxID=2917790 RepID=UPI002018C0D0|nr:putative lipopolysaccharide heptosyltransferase III [Wielerella bovis]ULJ59833.1 putative lipopolysaccharide heptosyltransferase III [Wielerella bovis]
MPKRFLIIKLRHHGDVLLTTPVVDALKHAYPDCEVDMLVYAETADIIRENSQINQIFIIDRNWKKQGIKQQFHHEFTLLGSLKARKYDYVLNFSDQWRAAIIAKLCGQHAISYRFGKRDNAAWRWCHDTLVDDFGKNNHIVEAHLQVLAPLNLPEYMPRVRMEISSQTQASFQEKLRGQGWQGEDYVAIHPGSRWFFKCWDDDKMAALLQKLLDNGQNIVLTAAPDLREQKMIETLIGSLKMEGDGKLFVLSGCLDLRELAAAIAGAKLFIGVDSVPMHMAAALDKPQVALFGATWVFRWRPYSDKATVIWAGDFGALPHPDSINTDDETRLLSAIPVDAVWEKVAEKLGIEAA